MNHGEPTQPPMNQYKCTETGNEIMIVYIIPATGKLANSTTIYINIKASLHDHHHYHQNLPDSK